MNHSTTSLWITLACTCLLWSGSARAGCEKDTECKGDRICEAGRCVSPGGSGSSKEPGTWTSPTGMPPPPEAPALCTGDGDCKGGQVCEEGECRVPAAPTKTSPGQKAARAQAALFPTVKARFKPEQLESLRLAGCLNKTGALMADRLVGRGFTAGDFVAACREDRAIRAANPEVAGYPRGTVETLAAARELELSRPGRLQLLRHRHGKGRTLTDAYNRTVVGGDVQELVGWSLTGAGVAAVLTGLILIPVAADHVVSDGPGIDLDEDGYGVASIIMLATGGALLVAGVPALVVGRQTQDAWLAPGTLEKADAKALHKRGKKRAGAGVSMMLTPTVGRGGAGLGLTGVF